MRECLLSLRDKPPTTSSWEILVVDNDSSDRSDRMVAGDFPEAFLIRNSENLGFAKANNQLIEASHGGFLLLLNPDVQVKARALDALLQLIKSENTIGAVAPRLLNPDGSVQPSCRVFPGLEVLLWESLGLSRLFPRSRAFGKYRMTWWDYDDLREVEQPMASALLLRRKALEQVGVFDENFPIFFNDVDLCYRLRHAGWKVLFTPAAEMVHHLGASTAQMKQRIRDSHRSLARFLRKHYLARRGPLRYGLCLILIWLGEWVRLAGSRLASQRAQGGKSDLE